MLILNITNIPQGHSTESIQIESIGVGLEDRAEFSHTVNIRYDFNRVGHEIFIKAFVDTLADLVCDRCLDSFSKPLVEEFDIILTTNKHLDEDGDEDIFYYEGESAEIDVTESFKDTILLAIPIKKICKTDCKGMCPQCGINWNFESCDCDNTKIDPRWDALKNISFEE